MTTAPFVGGAMETDDTPDGGPPNGPCARVVHAEDGLEFGGPAALPATQYDDDYDGAEDVELDEVARELFGELGEAAGADAAATAEAVAAAKDLRCGGLSSGVTRELPLGSTAATAADTVVAADLAKQATADAGTSAAAVTAAAAAMLQVRRRVSTLCWRGRRAGSRCPQSFSWMGWHLREVGVIHAVG